ncbi:MAG: hypothetical protein EPO23_06980 [Xanthobacteraceae bacterium]|nr:MAG: hypothetical protein EPO23_06980 [Xanthobacteraceae bacterium]
MTQAGRARRVLGWAVPLALAVVLAGCETFSLPSFGPSAPPLPAEPPPEPELPASIRADEIVGRWGYAAYHKPDDRARTEAAAKNQCRQPYVINPGTSGGVIMHLADEAQPQELRLKGSRGGKNYIGPSGPPGGEKDREIVSFDGRVIIMRFVDKDAATRYGTGVYVRCAPRA